MPVRRFDLCRPTALLLANAAVLLLLTAPASRADEPAPKAQYQEELFPLRDIRLLDGPFARQQQTNLKYLLKLEPDRLLSWFRREAGLEPKAPPYRGWESEAPTLPGHILGFFMSGAAMTFQATGDPALRQRLDYIVDQLAEVQEANHSGYLLPVAGGKKLFADVAAGNFRITNASRTYGYQINNVFEPTYTWNKITLGLYQVYLATGNEKAKEVLIRTADWLGHDVLDKLSDEQVQTLLFCEHGSIHESMVDVYLLTGDDKYLKWARRLCFDRMLEPLADNHGDFLDGYHANCSIPIYTGFERVYDYTLEPRLHAAAANFLDEVINHRSWVIGGNSANEHFFPPADFERALHAPAGPETCNSVNMLRLIEALYPTRPTPAMLEQYERILWNHLLAAHEPERGMICYYTPMQPGTYRVYSDEFDSMWCCVGTGLECPGKYGQMIYTHPPGRSSLDVNLFIASTLDWKEAGVAFRQETHFPDDPDTTLTFTANHPEPFTLRVRHPAWIPAGEMKITVNGQPVDDSSKPGEFAQITRPWRNGDTMHVSLPMHLSMEPLPHSTHYAAFLYGPIVLSGALGTEGLSKFDFWQINTTVPRKIIPEQQFPAIVASAPSDLLAHIKPVPGKPLTFHTDGGLMKPADVDLIPFFRNHYQRYALYWRTLTPDAWQQEQKDQQAAAQRQQDLDARTIDRVLIGDSASETAHAFKGQRTNTGLGAYGQQMETHWRDAASGGFFSYDLKILPSQPITLSCTYWGQESGPRAFDILINARPLTTVTLKDTGKADFFTVETPIPADFLGASPITIRFQPHPNNSAGGLFDLRILRQATTH